MNRLLPTVMLLAFTALMANTSVSLAQKENNDTCEGPIYNPKEVTKKARMKKVTEPMYTEEARANRVQGTVILTAVFCRNGKVTDIEVVQSLPYGLTERSTETTRRIEFEPAEKDGEVVSQRFRRELNFRLF